jgi:hypothetical protein
MEECQRSRRVLLLQAVAFAGGCGTKELQFPRSSKGTQAVSDIKIERVQPEDEEILEEWSRETQEPDLRGVGAARSSDEDWPWTVNVSVIEFIRVQPLESELAAAITTALADVDGVKQVHHEGRETWIISGQADGSLLAHAAAAVVDQFSVRTKAVLDALDAGDSAPGVR